MKKVAMTALMFLATLALMAPSARADKAVPLTKAEKAAIVGGSHFRSRVRITFRRNTTPTFDQTVETTPTTGVNGQSTVVNQSTRIRVRNGTTTIRINGTVVDVTTDVPVVINQSNTASFGN